MGTLTIRVPDDTHERLRRLADARGSADEGLRLLDKLDRAYAGTAQPRAAYRAKKPRR